MPEQPDGSAAIAMAQACGVRVEVLGSRTETEQIFANPDGTTTSEAYALPQRVRLSDGSWTALDATLQRNTDGTVSPKASTMDMRLSGGGEAPLIAGEWNGKGISLSWPGKLPQPVLNGAKATYPEVMAGVDLVVTAHDTGFSEVLVVKNQAAAANPALRKLVFGSALKGLSWKDDNDQLKAVDSAGRPMLAATAPLMWDSTPGTSSVSTVDGPSDNARKAPIAVTLDAAGVALTPDAGLLADPHATFPMFIDPTLTTTTWTMINSKFPDQSYWSFDKQSCPSGYTTDCAKVGYSDYDTIVMYRSMWQFPASSYYDKQILGAKFTIDLIHSSSCTNSTTELRLVSATLSSSTDWNNTASKWGGSNLASVSNSDCSDARKLTEFSGTSLTSTIATAASAHWSATTLGLKAANETVYSNWKKFDAKTAKLIVTVNTPPNIPDTLTVDAKACASGTNRPWVATATPKLKSRLTDADGNTMTDYFAYAMQRYTDIPIAGDFNGDGKDDAGFWRPSDGTWTVATTGGTVGNPHATWGLAGDIPLVGDFNGDGKDDTMIWRPSDGKWYLWNTGGTGAMFHQWGVSGDVPLVGDFDGDGKDDTMVFRPSTGTWFVWYASAASGVTLRTGWGGVADIPLVGDFNGDGKDDTMVFRPSTGEWIAAYTGGTIAVLRVAGKGGHVPLIGDLDKDGKADTVYYSSSDGRWYVGYTGGGAAVVETQTTPSGQALLGDLDGDGRPDKLSFQGGTWQVGYGTSPAIQLYTGLGANTMSFVDVGSGSQTSIANGSYGELTTTPLAEGVYSFRSQSNDGNAASPLASGCEFQVDVTKPADPAVASEVYPVSGCMNDECGSVGKTGRFTITSDSDVKSYKWGFTDPPATPVTLTNPGDPFNLDWTPSASGPHTLFVQAIDRAGNAGTVVKHQFYVAAPTPAKASWQFNEGGCENVGDECLYDMVNGNNAKWYGGQLGMPGRLRDGATALSFDGTAGPYVSSVGSGLIDSSKSFSVSAWVKVNPNPVDSNMHLVVEQGPNNNSFILEYINDGAAGLWKFTAPTTNDWQTSAWPGAAAAGARVGVWTHLTGVYDSVNKTLSLYVNGVLADTETNIIAWAGDGPIRIGGSTNRWANASIADVKVWDRKVSTEIAEMNGVDKIGEWKFEEVGPGPAFDTSDKLRNLEFKNGAAVPAGGSGLHLDGVDDYATPNVSVLNTDQSYTVSARVRLRVLPATGAFSAAVSQGGTDREAFMLYAQNGRWHYSVRRTDGTYVDIQSTTAAVAGQFANLVGVYDAQSQQVKLYVDGVLQGSAAYTATWNAAESFQIGRTMFGGSYTSYWDGDIDDVRVYQTAITNLALIS